MCDAREGKTCFPQGLYKLCLGCDVSIGGVLEFQSDWSMTNVRDRCFKTDESCGKPVKVLLGLGIHSHSLNFARESKVKLVNHKIARMEPCRVPIKVIDMMSEQHNTYTDTNLLE